MYFHAYTELTFRSLKHEIFTFPSEQKILGELDLKRCTCHLAEWKVNFGFFFWQVSFRESVFFMVEKNFSGFCSRKTNFTNQSKLEECFQEKLMLVCCQNRVDTQAFFKQIWYNTSQFWHQAYVYNVCEYCLQLTKCIMGRQSLHLRSWF